MNLVVFIQIPFVLFSLASAGILSSDRSRWVPKQGKTYELDEIEKAHLATPKYRYDYLTNVFTALMTAEDVDRAYRVLKRIRAWGKYSYTELKQDIFLKQSEGLHDRFDKFVLNLRKQEEHRRTNCTDANREMIELARRDSRPSNSPCVDVQESESEKIVINSIFAEIIRGNIQNGWAILESTANMSLRPRLFRIELVLILLRLASTRRQPCLDLWDDRWNITPYQKFVLVRTYETALNAGISRDLPEAVVSSMTIFTEIRDLFPTDGSASNPTLLREVLDRLLLALGNHQVEARLASQTAFITAVNECRAKRGEALQQKIVYQVPVQPIRQTTITYVQPPPQAIVVPKVNPAIVRVAAAIPSPLRMETVVVPRIKSAPRIVIQKPVAPCPLPDHRYLIDGGRTLKQGLKWFLETTNLTAAQINEINSLINLTDTVERTIKQHSRA